MGNSKGSEHTKEDTDNTSRQLNPEHDAYWQSRGYEGRPDSSSDDEE